MKKHPLETVTGTQWHVEITDLTSPLSSSREVLENYRDSAPNAIAAGYLQGLIDTRAELAAVMGVRF